MKRYTIKNLQTQFPDDNACLEYIFKARWPDGVDCSKCGKITGHSKRSGLKTYACNMCGTAISPTADTIFHKSSTPLTFWFHAMFLIASTRAGISAKQLERELGVTYKTAWRMFHQIRKLMDEGSGGSFAGPVEADETYVGGIRRGTPRGRPGPESHKSVVFGLVERQGSVMAQVVPDVKTRTLLPLVWKNVPAYEGNQVYTDELASYNMLSKMGYQHGRVRHGAGIYVDGDAHVNTIEGFWSLVKRGIGGVYHSVSPQHLQAYLNEYAFRYNHRKSEAPMCQVLMDRVPVVAAQ